jgi:DNA-binding transcriptional MerR regulator
MVLDAELLTTGEFAALAGMSQDTVRKYCNAGLIPFIKVKGFRLLERPTAAAAQAVKASRMARRGRWRASRRAGPPPS